MRRITLLWLALKSSLWFVPSLMLCGAVLAAVGLVELEPVFDIKFEEHWPRLFGAGAEGSRSMLSAIATSMITVAGVVFSITVVALSLAASQYSPRLLRNFMSDRTTQAVLGAFVSIFAYCLIVLRTIRGPEEGGAFVPSLAVLGGVVLAFVGIFLLVYFVHHVASSIQVSSILERIADETQQAIDRLFPDDLGRPVPDGEREAQDDQARRWTDIPAPCSGYLVSTDGDALLKHAEDRALVIELVPGVGDFVIQGRPVLRVAGDAVHAQTGEALVDCLRFGRQRTVHQDVLFGLQQIVDIALRALSPGTHDPSTAVSCIDQLGALMVAAARREMPGPYRSSKGALRLIARGPDFASMLSLSFDAITDHAANHVEVHARILATLGQIADATIDAQRRQRVASQIDLVLESIRQAKLPAWRLEVLERQGSDIRLRMH